MKTLLVPDDLHHNIKRIALERHMTLRELIEHILTDWLRRQTVGTGDGVNAD